MSDPKLKAVRGTYETASKSLQALMDNIAAATDPKYARELSEDVAARLNLPPGSRAHELALTGVWQRQLKEGNLRGEVEVPVKYTPQSTPYKEYIQSTEGVTTSGPVPESKALVPYSPDRRPPSGAGDRLETGAPQDPNFTMPVSKDTALVPVKPAESTGRHPTLPGALGTFGLAATALGGLAGDRPTDAKVSPTTKDAIPKAPPAVPDTPKDAGKDTASDKTSGLPKPPPAPPKTGVGIPQDLQPPPPLSEKELGEITTRRLQIEKERETITPALQAELNQRVAEMKAEKDEVKKQELLEGVLGAIGNLAAAWYAMKNEVPISNLTLPKTDWDARRRDVMADFDAQTKIAQQKYAAKLQELTDRGMSLDKAKEDLLQKDALKQTEFKNLMALADLRARTRQDSIRHEIDLYKTQLAEPERAADIRYKEAAAKELEARAGGAGQSNKRAEAAREDMTSAVAALAKGTSYAEKEAALVKAAEANRQYADATGRVLVAPGLIEAKDVDGIRQAFATRPNEASQPSTTQARPTEDTQASARQAAAAQIKAWLDHPDTQNHEMRSEMQARYEQLTRGR